MTRIPKTARALVVAALPALLPLVSCGPPTVVARLATPAAVAPAAATPAAPPSPARPSPTPRPPAPTATPTSAPTRTPTIAPPRPPRAVPPTATSTRVPSPTPVETRAESAARPATPAPPAPSFTAAPPPPTPAPVTASAVSLIGEWDFHAETGGGVIAGTLRFRPAPEGLAGVYIGLRGNATQLSNLSASGNRIAFDLVSPTTVWHLEGAVSGDSISGTFQTAERLIRWTASRKPSS